MRSNRSSAMRAAAALVALTLTAACSSESPTTPLQPHGIAATSGSNAQVGTVGKKLANPVTVQVLDPSGAGLAGVLVTWSVVLGGGSVDVITSLTDAGGFASAHWTLGTAAGIDSLMVFATGGLSVGISATANASEPVALLKVSGDEQVVVAGSDTDPFVVKAVDAFGNAVAGVTISWISVSGGFLSANSTVSGSDGLAQISLTTDQPAGYSVVAQLQAGSLATATFTATGT